MSKAARKGMVIALIVLLLTCMFSTAGAYKAWPTKSFYGVGVSVRVPPNYPNVQRPAYFGPNSNYYPTAGAFKARAVQNATAWFREGDFALVDFYYPSMGKYCLYFQVQFLSNRNISYESLTSYPAYVTSEVQPMQGPGYDYHPLEEVTPRRAVRQVYLSRRSRINVFFEMRGWVFAEFSCSLGMVRGWIPSGVVASY